MAGNFQPPPIQGQSFLEGGAPSYAWAKWFELIPPALTSPAASGSVPASATAQGIQGQIATDGAYLYICTGVNQWKRVALASF
jgi:hypothetical protein